MPKEIANKTKGETYPSRELVASNGANIRIGGNEEDRQVVKK